MNASPLSAAQLELTASLWPKRFFATESAWIDYVAKWYPIVTKNK